MRKKLLMLLTVVFMAGCFSMPSFAAQKVTVKVSSNVKQVQLKAKKKYKFTVSVKNNTKKALHNVSGSGGISIEWKKNYPYDSAQCTRKLDFGTIKAGQTKKKKVTIIDSDWYYPHKASKYKGHKGFINAFIMIQSETKDEYGWYDYEEVESNHIKVTCGKAKKAKATKATSSAKNSKKSLNNASISLSSNEYTYNGKTKKPTVTVKLSGKKLKKGTDFTVAVKNNSGSTVKTPKAAGSYKVVVTGKGKYKGSKRKKYTIKKADITLTVQNKTITKTYADIGSSFPLGVKANVNATYTYKTSNSRTAAASANTVRVTGSGKATITVTATPDNKNYKSKSVSVTINVLPKKGNVKAYFKGISGSQVTFTANYTDDYFMEPATQPSKQKELAKLSLAGASAAYDGTSLFGDAAAAGAAMATITVLGTTFLENCGFNDCIYQYSWANGDSPTEDDNDHVGVTFGHKDLGDYTLVAVLVKGTSGDYEWISNFNLGNGTVHAGFNNAKNEVRALLNQYVNTYSQGKSVKFWVTGHSRGAGVANLLAHDLNQRYPADQVYAYTFASPRVASKTILPSTKEKNIFNYLNPGDFVTEVVPEATGWNFGRYGQDITYSEQASIKAKMNYYFIEHTGAKYAGYSNSGKNNLVRAFCEYGVSQDAYDYNYPMDLSLLPSNLAVSGIITSILGLKSISPRQYCQYGLGMCLAGHTDVGLSVIALAEASTHKPREVTGKMIIEGKVLHRFAHAHCQESYMAWLDAM